MPDALDCLYIGSRGPRVALLHGWGWDGRLLAPLAQVLGERCRVAQPDLPGYGRNVDRRCGSFDECVDQLMRAVPDAEAVVGWSLGGLLAIAWAARAPVRKLALIGASPRFMQAADWPHGMTDERFDAFAGEVHEQPLRARTRFAALAALGDADAKRARGAMSSLVEQAPQPSAQVLAQGLDWLHETDLRDTLRALSARTFHLHGEQDRVIDVAAARQGGVTADARRLCVPGAAHLPWLHGGMDDLRNWVSADD